MAMLEEPESPSHCPSVFAESHLAPFCFDRIPPAQLQTRYKGAAYLQKEVRDH